MLGISEPDRASPKAPAAQRKHHDDDHDREQRRLHVREPMHRAPDGVPQDHVTEEMQHTRRLPQAADIQAGFAERAALSRAKSSPA